MKNLQITNKFLSNSTSSKADVLVFGVPFDSTVDFLPGTRFGPKIIREAANYIEPFDLESQKNLLEEIKIADIGDVQPVKANSEKTVERVRKQVKNILQKGKFPLMLGGEHTISLGAVKTLPKNTKIISFDAHFDLKEVWEGSSITHSTWLRRSCEIIDPKNVCLIGVRTGDEFELEYAEKEKILVNPDADALKKFVARQKVYLSVDMDVFDPSIAPGVGTPEPGGLSYSEILEKFSVVYGNAKMIGMDIVEARPISDNKITEILAAKVLFRVLYGIFTKV